MSRPSLNAVPEAAGAPRHFPAPGEEARRAVEQLPAALRRAAPPELPARHEAALRRHFAPLAALPRPEWPSAAVAERAARLPGLAALHPRQPAPTLQGALEAAHEVARALAAFTGLERFSLQPPCLEAAQRAALRIAVACFARIEPQRAEVLGAEDSPLLAQAAEMGLAARPVGRLPSGDLDVEELDGAIGPATALVAASWLTPEGRLDRNLAATGQLARVHGALLGVDATGLARLAGHTRLREAAADIAWLPLAELCPAATGAALGVRSHLTQYLPGPLVGKDRSGYVLDDELPGTVGPLALTAAPLEGVLLAYVALRALGEEGLRRRAVELDAPGGGRLP